MGTLKDDLKGFIDDIKGDMNLEFDLDAVFNRPYPGTNTPMKDHFIDQWVQLNWSMPGWSSVHSFFGASANPNILLDPVEYATKVMYESVNGVLYALGEGIEGAIEGLIGMMFEIGIWLMDVLWTDIILNQIIKWTVWIIVAGLRVVIAAPSYILGKKILSDILDKLAAMDLNEWVANTISVILPNSSQEGTRSDLSATILHQLHLQDAEGLVAALDTALGTENMFSGALSTLFGTIGSESDGN